MYITGSQRLNKLGGYAFDEVDKIVAGLKVKGITPIDFGVGDPSAPTPQFVQDATASALKTYETAGYPSYIGQKEFRTAAVKWMDRRFGISLDPEKEITSTIGGKESVFNFPECLINPGDIVIIPSPGYPPYTTGTIFAEGEPHFVPLLEENNFLIDYDAIPEDIAKRAKVIWINYPNSPTGVCATREWYDGLIAWAKKHEIVIAADEGCYIDVYFGEKPLSILEIEREGIITFYSMSKRNNMTGYRVGWVAGDERLVTLFKKLKTNIDSGTPNFIQVGAIAALQDEAHAKQMREEYRAKKDVLLAGLREAGLPPCDSDATFYLWQKTPEGMDSVELAKRFLVDEVAVVVTPGSWISKVCDGGVNPGEQYVRFALMPSVEEMQTAVERMKNYLDLSV
jgi:LL-diaminopimelate aminotransferase